MRVGRRPSTTCSSSAMSEDTAIEIGCLVLPSIKLNPLNDAATHYPTKIAASDSISTCDFEVVVHQPQAHETAALPSVLLYNQQVDEWQSVDVLESTPPYASFDYIEVASTAPSYRSFSFSSIMAQDFEHCAKFHVGEGVANSIELESNKDEGMGTHFGIVTEYPAEVEADHVAAQTEAQSIIALPIPDPPPRPIVSDYRLMNPRDKLVHTEKMLERLERKMVRRGWSPAMERMRQRMLKSIKEAHIEIEWDEFRP